MDDVFNLNRMMVLPYLQYQKMRLLNRWYSAAINHIFRTMDGGGSV